MGFEEDFPKSDKDAMVRVRVSIELKDRMLAVIERGVAEGYKMNESLFVRKALEKYLAELESEEA